VLRKAALDCFAFLAMTTVIILKNLVERAQCIMSQPSTAYKILTADQWSQFQTDGVFHGAPIDIADGYIHMSTADQLSETLSKRFAGKDNLTIAEVDLTGFGADLKWEVSRGGALFPHLYAPLPLAAVTAVRGA
jgi:uncharacterized protein (DUF952 family)